MKKRLYLVCVLVLALNFTTWAEDPVYFADVNLKAAVEAKLRFSNPTPIDMKRLIS